MNQLTTFVCVTITGLSLSFGAMAKLPDPSPEAKEAAKLAAAKTDYGNKVAAYQLCQAQNKVARSYAVKGKVVETPACVEPGEFKPPEVAALPAAAPATAAPAATAAVAAKPAEPAKK